jgi:hypothetical protein
LRTTAVPPITIDEPTIAIQFNVNNGPLPAAKASSHFNLRDRLDKELLTNVSLDTAQARLTPSRCWAANCSSAPHRDDASRGLEMMVAVPRRHQKD